jgi:hypothetical protein
VVIMVVVVVVMMMIMKNMQNLYSCKNDTSRHYYSLNLQMSLKLPES